MARFNPSHPWKEGRHRTMSAILPLMVLFVASGLWVPLASGQIINYNGGPTMQGPIKVFFIFWEPTGSFFDSTTSTSDSTYQALLPRFVSDLAPSSYFNILTQYFGSCQSDSSSSCVIPNTAGIVSVGGTFTDTRAYPHAGSTTDPLQDSDIRAEIESAIRTNGWAVNPNNEFFVFTTAGTAECSDPAGGCTFLSSKGPAFCGYHESFRPFSPALGTIIYAFIADPACTIVRTAPNLASADSATEDISHELFESITDPMPDTATAWGGAGEIGDSCGGVLGTRRKDGSNVTLNTNNYLVQEIFSNDTLLCTLAFGPTVQLTAATGNDDLRFDSSVLATLRDGTGTAFQGLPFKTVMQSTWGDRTSQVRVFGVNNTTLGSVTLAMSPGGPGFDDEWKLQAFDLRVFDPQGNQLCDQNQSSSSTPIADMKQATPTFFLATPNCSPSTTTNAFDSIEIVIRTGNDDARSDSEVTATIPGQASGICLKPSQNSGLSGDPVCTQNGSGATDQQGHSTWDNFTNSDQVFKLPTTETAASGFSTMTVIFTNSDPSCDSFTHQGCDNWDIEGITVSVFNSQGPTPARTTLLNLGNLSGGSGDDCLARLKSPHNRNAMSVTFGLDGSGSHVYGDGKFAGNTTNCKNNGDGG
jgi:hypothetical protein